MDIHDNSIITYTLGNSCNNQLVFDTLNYALKAEDYPELLIHSDRGTQYTSHGFKRIAEKSNLTHSMSRVGRCIDNGPIESFWSIIKTEKYYLNKYETFQDLKDDIDDYMYFYNNERLQYNLEELSPIEYRTKYLS